MTRRGWNWIIIAAVVALALVSPIWQVSQERSMVRLGLDLRGGVEVLLQAKPVDPDGNPMELSPPDLAAKMQGVMEVIRVRVDPDGTKELMLSQVADDRILLQVPGEKDPDSVLAIIGETALLEFVNIGNDHFEQGTNFNDPITGTRKPEFAKYNVEFTGEDLSEAFPDFDQYNKMAIGFKFHADSGDEFGRFTNNHQGQHLAILLDGVVLTCPEIITAIWGGQGQITGMFDFGEVDKIVRQLNAGALPVPLETLSSSVVGPTLGQESINKSIIAGIVGFIIVLLYMIVFYRVSGVVAAAVLSLYVVLVLGYFSLIDATLTLPGIAGFILSIGMAIDGNIIIFERLKEEIKWGKTLVAAMDAAFSRAWVAIFDGNVTTLIGAAVLFFFGSGPVKGFAITLSLGILLSVFSAVFVTRNIMELMVRNITNQKLYS